MNRIVLFCPDIAGHRHLYCRRLIDYFRSRDVAVVLATAGRCAGFDAGGAPRFEPFADTATSRLFRRDGVEHVDLHSHGGGAAGSLEQAVHLCRSIGIDDILHVDADLYRLALARGGGRARDLRHHLILIFTEFVDWAGRVSPAQEVRFAIHALRRRPLRGNLLGDRTTMVERLPRFSRKLFARIAVRDDVRTIITTDERIEHLIPDSKVVVLPEIGSSRWELDETEPPDEYSLRVIGKIEEFLRSHPGKRVFSMLGDLENRKGFDLLLGLCAAMPDSVCIRIGRTKPHYQNTWACVGAKETLLHEDRLLEIDTYVGFWRVFDRVLSEQSISVLPYRDFYRTSGTFVDSLMTGLPVVVPEVGLMAHRVRSAGLGTTFRSGDGKDLRRAVDDCLAKRDDFALNVANYGETLARESIFALLDRRFTS